MASIDTLSGEDRLGRRLLLVEDDPAVQRVLAIALSNARNLWMSVGRRTLPATLHVQGIE